MAFNPPAASTPLLNGVDFANAVDFAPAAKQKFDQKDAAPGNQDPSKCKALLKFPDNGQTPGPVFWSAKMAIDADGPAAGPGRLPGSQLDPGNGSDQDSTSYTFPSSARGLPAETIPYIVLPMVRPGSNKPFDPLLSLGDVAIVIFKDKMVTAVCGDLGPSNKIGEASIRVHEMLEPGCPDPCTQRDAAGNCRRVRNSSVGQDVLYFVFPNSSFPTSELTLDTINDKVSQRALDLFNKFRGAT